MGFCEITVFIKDWIMFYGFWSKFSPISAKSLFYRIMAFLNFLKAHFLFLSSYTYSISVTYYLISFFISPVMSSSCSNCLKTLAFLLIVSKLSFFTITIYFTWYPEILSYNALILFHWSSTSAFSSFNCWSISS